MSECDVKATGTGVLMDVEAELVKADRDGCISAETSRSVTPSTCFTSPYQHETLRCPSTPFDVKMKESESVR